MNFRKRTYYFFINEIRQLKSAPLPVILAFVLPVLVWIWLSLIFKNGAIENIPVAIVDYDNSSISRLIIRSIDATQALEVVSVEQSREKADSLFKCEKAIFTVFIDKNAAEDLKSKKSTRVSILTNGASLMYAKVGYKAMAQSLLTLSHGIQIKRLNSQGMTPKEALSRAVPISTEIQAPGNPYFNYTIYMLPGMLISILQMSASFSMLWLFREHREHEAGRILPGKKHRLSFIIGKSMPLAIVNIAAATVLFAFIFPAVDIPINNDWFLIYLLTLLLVFVSMGMGAFMSVALKNLVSASQALLVINAPSFVFSGYTFPRWAMPQGVSDFAHLIPVTHYLDAFFPMFLYSIPTWRGILPLFIIGFVLWGGVFLLTGAPGRLLRENIAKIKGHK